MTEFVFPSHTSIISKELLFQKLAQEGIVSKPQVQRPKLRTQSKDVEVTQQMSRRQKNVEQRRKLRRLVLDEKFDNGLGDGEEPLKRVQIECLDFDWIFDGDNAKILLSVLAD
jgi:hypothetical protein